MDAVSAGVTTGLVVTVGRWSQGKGLEASVVIGAGVYSIILSGIANSQPVFANKIATTVLITALFVYIIPIVNNLGFANLQPINKQSLKLTRLNNPTSTP